MFLCFITANVQIFNPPPTHTQQKNILEHISLDYFAPLTQDLSGRPYLSCGLDIPTERVGTYDTQVICELHRFLPLMNFML
jgi:hypothetical protein